MPLNASTITILVLVSGLVVAGITLIVIGSVRRGNALRGAPCSAVMRTDVEDVGVHIVYILGGLQMLVTAAHLAPALVRAAGL